MSISPENWEKRRIALSDAIFPLIEHDLGDKKTGPLFICDVLGTLLATSIVILSEQIDPSYKNLTEAGRIMMVEKLRSKIAALCTEEWPHDQPLP